MLIQEPVQAAIWHCLNNYDFSDATFLAERLTAEVNSEEANFLLATCYYRSGKTAQAYDLLQRKGADSPQSKFLLAKCCLDLQKLAEAEHVLSARESWEQRQSSVIEGQIPLDEVVKEFGELACFALQLLARICAQTKRLPRASEAYHKCLLLNPFMWTSFEELCNLGEKPDPAKTFQLSNVENFATCVGTAQMIQPLQQGSSVSLSSTGEFCTPSDAVIIGSRPKKRMFSTPMGPPSSALAVPFNDLTPTTTGQGGAAGGLVVPMAPATARNKHLRGRGLMQFGSQSLSPLTPSFGVLPLDDSTLSLLDCSSRSSPVVPPIMSLSMFVAKTEQRSGSKRVLSRQKSDSPLQQAKPVFSQSGNTPSPMAPPPSVVSIAAGTPPSTQTVQPPNQSVRRSSRLFSSNNSCSVKENNKSPNRNKFATPKSPSRKSNKSKAKSASISAKGNNNYNELNEKNREDSLPVSETITSSALISGSAPIPSVTVTSESVTMLQKQSAQGLMSLLAQLGSAYLSLAQYDCKSAVDKIRNLPPNHYYTGWALCMEGKAYYELADYKQAVKAYEECRSLEPARLQGMEVLSTALWYLEREVALSNLSHELQAIDRLSVEAWCAAGNCFSQQKEHDTAIKFFQRAIQVNPKFAYAYSLLGHEYVQTEELDKAISCFRAAIRIDQRHYNAWLGVGSIFYKQERFSLAEIHFKKALAINPNSSVIMCYVAVALHALHKTDRALQILNTAIAANPRNAMCKFNRAKILFASERYQEALQELEELKEIVPKESQVYFLTGKVHSKLGNTHLELMHFSWMMDLDPKGANSQIKEAMDPALSRSMANTTLTEDGASNNGGSSFSALAPDPLSSSLQEAAVFDFNSPQVHDSDESL